MSINPREWLKNAASPECLLNVESGLTGIIEAQAKEIQDLKNRVTRLEAREQILIAEAKGSAAAAASAVASQHVAEIARQVGTLDERTRHLRRLPSPDPDRE